MVKTYFYFIWKKLESTNISNNNSNSEGSDGNSNSDSNRVASNHNNNNNTNLGTETITLMADDKVIKLTKSSGLGSETSSSTGTRISTTAAAAAATLPAASTAAEIIRITNFRRNPQTGATNITISGNHVITVKEELLDSASVGHLVAGYVDSTTYCHSPPSKFDSIRVKTEHVQNSSEDCQSNLLQNNSKCFDTFADCMIKITICFHFSIRFSEIISRPIHGDIPFLHVLIDFLHVISLIVNISKMCNLKLEFKMLVQFFIEKLRLFLLLVKMFTSQTVKSISIFRSAIN